jgi:hypothetical protein
MGSRYLERPRLRGSVGQSPEETFRFMFSIPKRDPIGRALNASTKLKLLGERYLNENLSRRG